MSALAQLCQEIVACRDCDLAQCRTRVVPGEGAEDADLLFIGEAPGWHEDQQGRPFVGPAGQFLDQLLEAVGLRRGDVYIANVIKCRPPQNREPLPAEIEACRRWLDRQVELIRPRMIVTLGRHSLSRYFPTESISKAHGRARQLNGVIYYPMYHPAAALHQGSLRQTIEADMLKIPQILAQSGASAQNTTEDHQLSMF
jgi:uracil-DNA glycosylase